MHTPLKQTVSAAVDYIELHMKRSVTLEDVADAVYMSKFHLHRLFKLATGRTMADYIRGRKLASSFELLLDSAVSLLAVSIEYGFEHEQSYIRAFKREFGITPGQYRRTGQDQLKVTEKLDIEMMTTIGSGDGAIFQPYYVVQPAILLAGRKSIIYYRDNEETYEANSKANVFYEQDWPRIKNKIVGSVYIGLTTEMTHDRSCYMTAARVAAFDGLPDDLDSYVVPANQYAVFRYVCSFHPSRITVDHLDQIWSFIEDYWRKHSVYVWADRYYFEWVDESIASEEYGELDLYLPVRLRE
ncbi:AraC family transcriptional regulator [Paenibacillus kobensis]|uniref:AraC family transcriptional regulator n=1 Tax=Paenibacillus kobensis TaxID=59841 RepID=UPI000FDA5F2F|nr:AraC family transcriptional regulator [Paenibacillus kobensis]